MKNKIGYLLLSQNAKAEKSELETSTFPYTFSNSGSRLKNYRIYGNTGGVGDLDSDTEKYIIPVIINNEQSAVISLTEPLFKVNADSDYVEYRTQKIVRKIFKVTATAANVRRTNDHTWYVAKTAYPAVKRVGSGNDVVSIACNCLPNGTSSNTDCCFINNTGTIRFNTESAYSTVDELLADFGDMYFWIICANSEDYDEQFISLPPLVLADGENTIDFDTNVKPSKIYLQGKIDTIQQPELQISQQGLQNLQDLSDTMDIDDTINDSFDEIMPIDTSNLQLNNVGGVESAE